MTPTRLLAALAICAFVSACTLPKAPLEESRDRVTASDESAGSKRARVRMELASGYFARGQYTTALDEVKQALLAEPNLGEAYNLRGAIYAALGDSAVAEESYRRALQINPRDGDVMHNLGWFFCSQKRYADASQWFAQALAVPGYVGGVRTLIARGVCEARAGRWADAEASLFRAYEMDSSNAIAAVNLSAVLLHQGGDDRVERARFYMKRVNAVAAQSTAETLWMAARIEMKLGKRDAANEYGLQLRNRFPQSRESAAFDRGQFDE
jgi:type IV pilus assembly protein PilF